MSKIEKMRRRYSTKAEIIDFQEEHRKKIYPNDPCPCGSGKKYKHCCGKKK